MPKNLDSREVVKIVAEQMWTAERERFDRVGGRKPGTYADHLEIQSNVAKRRDREGKNG